MDARVRSSRKSLRSLDELQRELEGTVIFCQKLGSLPSGQEGFDDQTRAKLQAECLRNVQAIRQRRHRFRRAAMLGAVGAIAACLLIALVVPWAANYQRPLAQTNADSAHLLVKSRAFSHAGFARSRRRAFPNGRIGKGGACSRCSSTNSS